MAGSTQRYAGAVESAAPTERRTVVPFLRAERKKDVTDRRKQIQDALIGMRQGNDVLGATLVSRDGICLYTSHTNLASPETFSAMTAALVGAAETAVSDLGGIGNLQVVTETDATKMLALPANDTMLLIVVAGPHLATHDLIHHGRQGLAALRTLLGGA